MVSRKESDVILQENLARIVDGNRGMNDQSFGVRANPNLSPIPIAL